MSDDDRSKRLLSKAALPKIVVPESSGHRMPNFKLPAAMSGGNLGENDTRGQEGPVQKKPAKRRKPAAVGKRPAAPSLPAGKPKRRPDSTLRFRDRTLNWFRLGDGLAEVEESDDYEPEAPRSRDAVLAWIVVIVLVVAVIILAWRLW